MFWSSVWTCIKVSRIEGSNFLEHFACCVFRWAVTSTLAAQELGNLTELEFLCTRGGQSWTLAMHEEGRENNAQINNAVEMRNLFCLCIYLMQVKHRGNQLHEICFKKVETVVSSRNAVLWSWNSRTVIWNYCIAIGVTQNWAGTFLATLVSVAGLSESPCGQTVEGKGWMSSQVKQDRGYKARGSKI
jgi:hypothetical protein